MLTRGLLPSPLSQDLLPHANGVRCDECLRPPAFVWFRRFTFSLARRFFGRCRVLLNRYLQHLFEEVLLGPIGLCQIGPKCLDPLRREPVECIVLLTLVSKDFLSQLLFYVIANAVSWLLPTSANGYEFR